nr:uncharacterized protein LOC111512373 isoform X2 [Leptinotarsa decemlineata]
MSTKDGPDNVIAENEKKPGTIIENYLVVKEENPEQTISRFYAFQTPNLSIAKPVSSIWKFMKEEELDQFMKLQRKSDIKKKIGYNPEPDVELPDPEIASGQFKGKIGEQGKKGKVKSQKTKSNKKGKS